MQRRMSILSRTGLHDAEYIMCQQKATHKSVISFGGVCYIKPGKLHKYSNNDDIWVRDDRGAITCLSVFRWQEHVKYEIDLFLALIAACLDMSIGSLIDRLKFLRLVDG